MKLREWNESALAKAEAREARDARKRKALREEHKVQYKREKAK